MSLTIRILHGRAQADLVEACDIVTPAFEGFTISDHWNRRYLDAVALLACDSPIVINSFILDAWPALALGVGLPRDRRSALKSVKAWGAGTGDSDRYCSGVRAAATPSTDRKQQTLGLFLLCDLRALFRSLWDYL